MTGRTYTHPDVSGKGVKEGWADPITDPTEIDWRSRQARALIRFKVVDGRPVNPVEPHLPGGRNELGHWGEKPAADALVFATHHGRRHALMVLRDDGHGWAIPGGCIDPGETPAQAASRELSEEAAYRVPARAWRVGRAEYVPDPRASREAWMVTVLCSYDLGAVEELPVVVGGDDAARAGWIPAGSYNELAAHLRREYSGVVFPGHIDMLKRSL